MSCGHPPSPPCFSKAVTWRRPLQARRIDTISVPSDAQTARWRLAAGAVPHRLSLLNHFDGPGQRLGDRPVQSQGLQCWRQPPLDALYEGMKSTFAATNSPSGSVASTY